MTSNPAYTDSVKYAGPILANGEKVPAYLTVCPICQGTNVHIITAHTKIGNDNYETKTGVRGDVYVILFFSECGSEFEINYGFHKGNTYVWPNVIKSCRLDYRAYIQSDEWKIKASAAKERAGWRCQVCNKSQHETILDAHHRTYERLGHELSDDITVLCRDCHELYERNRKARQNGGSR